MENVQYRPEVEKEQWAIVEDFPDYRISSFGRIINKHGRILKTYNQGKYDGPLINLYESPKIRKTRLLKRLMAQAFVEDVEDKNVLIIDIKKPLRISNLLILDKNRNG